mgnify:CR=1 FL=1|jgi:hypothetical protein
MAIISNLYQDRKPEKRRYRVRYRLPWMSKLFTIAEDLDHTMPEVCKSHFASVGSPSERTAPEAGALPG